MRWIQVYANKQKSYKVQSRDRRNIGRIDTPKTNLRPLAFLNCSRHYDQQWRGLSGFIAK